MSRLRSSLSLAIALVACTVACGSAPERHDPIPSPTTTTTDEATSTQTCELVPGEDACNRFQVLSSSTRAAMAYVTRYAADVLAALRALEIGCLDIITVLDVKSRPVAKGAPRERVSTVCTVALDALARELPDDLTAKVGAPNCHGAPIPTCIVEQFDRVWQTCLSPSVEIHTEDSPYGVALQRNLPALMATCDTMQSLQNRYATTQAELSWARGALAKKGDIESTCLNAGTAMLRTSDADLDVAVRITKRLRTVLKTGERR